MPPDERDHRDHDPKPVGDILVSYTADEMPTQFVTQIQHDVLEEYRNGELPVGDAFRIVNLLLNITLQKLQALA
jgi:hypothetical protein